jgi:hypothetical protein
MCIYMYICIYTYACGIVARAVSEVTCGGAVAGQSVGLAAKQRPRGPTRQLGAMGPVQRSESVLGATSKPAALGVTTNAAAPTAGRPTHSRIGSPAAASGGAVAAPSAAYAAQRTQQGVQELLANLSSQFKLSRKPVVLHTCGMAERDPRRNLHSVLGSLRLRWEDCVDARWPRPRGGSALFCVFCI